jgi:four helix bundle protein
MVIKLPYNIINSQDAKQVVRSSGSIGANYIEANETVGDKDFLFRLKISRKEAKESIYWLNLLKEMNDNSMNDEIEALISEAIELRKIFSSIINKFKQN